MLSANDILQGLEEEKFNRDGVILAAFFGHPAARELEPKIHLAPSDPESILKDLAQVVPFQSTDFRHVTIVRAALALTRPVLSLAKKRRAADAVEGFYAAQSWTLCPCPLCEEPINQLCYTGLQPTEPLELQMQYHVARVTLDISHVNRVLKGCVKLLGKKNLRLAIENELLGWSLHEKDPVRASIGDRVTWWLNPRHSDPGVRKLELSGLTNELYAELEKVSQNAKAPEFRKTIEIPVSRGEAYDMVPNELGLLVVSDRMREALKKIKSLEFAPLHLKTKNQIERHWLVYSLKPIDALHSPRFRNDQNPILDPTKVAKAPSLFRLENTYMDCYLIEKNFIVDLIKNKGLKTGIYVKGTAYGCALKKSRE